MRLRILLPMLFLYGGLGAALSVEAPIVDANGCTPCECNAAFCRGNMTYWPRLEVTGLDRGDNTATVRVRTFLEPPLASNDTQPFRSASHVVLAYGNESRAGSANETAVETDYPYRLTVSPVVYPGAVERTFVWPSETPVFVRAFTHSGTPSGEAVAEPEPRPHAPATTVTRIVQSPGLSVDLSLGLLSGVGAALAWRRRP